MNARKCVCPTCGRDFRWPGLLDHHLRFGECRR